MDRTRSTAADARVYQIAFLAVFLAYVLAFREFTLSLAAIAVIFATALATQSLFVRALRLPDPGPRSALISALSLCLLLRTNLLAVAALAGFLAIASKFILRWRGKHFFNPTNFGILATVLLTGQAWVSPAQWGSAVWLAFFLAALGLTVVRKASRLDISLAYLLTHVALQLGRALYLGERPAVFLHRLTSGALIVFIFFMISDPRSTPDSRLGRVLFAMLTALVAYHIQFHLFIPSAPLWALFVVSPATVVFDAIWRRPRFEWGEKGTDHVVSEPPRVALPAH